MSTTMAVYLCNHTKWPPITCSINLSCWWEPVDKTFIPTETVNGTFISSKMIALSKQCHWCEINWIITAGCVHIAAWWGWMMTSGGQNWSYRVMHRWLQLGALAGDSWSAALLVGLTFFLHLSSLHFHFKVQWVEEEKNKFCIFFQLNSCRARVI